MSSQELTDLALQLPLAERVELAQALWRSLDEARLPTDVIEEQRTIQIALERSEDLRSGRVSGRSHEEVFAAARRALV